MVVIIREIEYNDIDKGFLEVLENLLSPNIDNTNAKNILRKIISNPLHKIFVAYDKENNRIVGTTTLFIEPKFINKGMQVGYIEDVSVRKGSEGLGIGFKLVNYATSYAVSKEGCKKILLYCSGKNMLFYEKLGFKLANDTFVMKLE
ncbi:MAG TPA: GNAT family N-acetyltransferase [Nitrososphaeraceae archaeon]|nr:GNAT family N-acetyltransferase [Nitrososphaeraceae archaeon]